jgi:hypothetical protein
MIAWRSPVEFGPPSIATSGGIGYGPGSLWSAYTNGTWYVGVVCPSTTVIGIPIGPGPQKPAPKSAWRPIAEPIEGMVATEFEAMGSVSTRWFQGLSGGKTGHDGAVGRGRLRAPAAGRSSAATVMAANRVLRICGYAIGPAGHMAPAEWIPRRGAVHIDEFSAAPPS